MEELEWGGGHLMKETRRFLVWRKKRRSEGSMTTVTSLMELIWVSVKMVQRNTVLVYVCMCVVCVCVCWHICTCELSLKVKPLVHLIRGYPLLPGNSSHGNKMKQDRVLLSKKRWGEHF